MLFVAKLAAAFALFGSLTTSPFANAAALTDRSSGIPTTSTRVYEFDVTYQNHSADGFTRPMLLVNGQSPGPAITANEGDSLKVTFNNFSPLKWTVHMHGIWQRGSPSSDGVPGVSEVNIQPYGSYTYEFNVGIQYGLYWYHAHSRDYLADGLRGPILIQPAASRARPYSLITSNAGEIQAMEQAENNAQIVFVSDHSHLTSDQMMNSLETTGVDQSCLDSIIFNGHGRVYCPSEAFYVANGGGREFLPVNPQAPTFTPRGCIPVSEGQATNASTVLNTPCANTTAANYVFGVQGEQWAFLQVVGGYSEHAATFSIDNHEFYVVSVDGSYIKPELVSATPLNIGARLGLLVPLNQPSGQYAIRAGVTDLTQVLEGVALLSYTTPAHKSGPQWQPDSLSVGFERIVNRGPGAKATFNGTAVAGATMFDESTAVPFNATDVGYAVPQTAGMTVHFVGNATNSTTWMLGQHVFNFQDELETPVLFGGSTAQLTNLTFNTVVDIVLNGATTTGIGPVGAVPHAMHLHGHKFWVLGSGEGTFTYDTVAEAQAAGFPIDLNNPPSRDSFVLPAAGYLVLRFVADNPGAWLFHCHISDHQFSGMAAVLLEAYQQVVAEGLNHPTSSSNGGGHFYPQARSVARIMPNKIIMS